MEGKRHLIRVEQGHHVILAPDRFVIAARGNIMDRYGRLLVSNRNCNNLLIDTDELFEFGDKAYSNAAILRMCSIVTENGDTYTDELPITRTAPFEYVDNMTALQRTRLDAWLQANGLDARFHMLNSVPVAHLPAFYQLAELFVYPSRFEGFGIPLLEALCSGTPAIGCTGSCLEEAGGPSSIYVHPDDAQALAAAIHRVLSDATLRARMIADGYDFAQRFEPARLTDQLLDCYRRVLGHAPAAHP